MATQTLTQMDMKRAREQLKRSDAGWRSLGHDAYYGTMEDVVSAGLVRPEQLPGAKGMPSTSVTFYDGQIIPRNKRVKHDEKYVNIIRHGSGFKVFFGVPDSVVAEREAAADLADELCAAQYAAREQDKMSKQKVDFQIALDKVRAQANLAAMPISAKGYQTDLIDFLDSWSRIFRDRLLPKNKTSGFSFDESTIADFDDLLIDMRELLSHAGVQFDGRWQQQVVSGCKAHIAKADTGFQSALARMQSAN